MKINKKQIGDVGIRLKPDEPNLLENYTKFLKRTRKKKRKKKKKKKQTVKSIEIHKKKDPFLIVESDNKDKKDDKPDKKDDKPDKKDDKPDKKPEIKKVKVEKSPQDLSEKDPNVKKLVITASTEPDQKKKGTQIKLE
jgi:Ran-binding protein 1